MRKLPILTVTLALCIILAYAFWQFEPQQTLDENEETTETNFVQLTKEQLRSHGVKIRQASSGTLKNTVKAPAKITIASNRIAHIFPKSSGIVIQAHKNLGEQVSAGEALVTLESKEVAEAKSTYLAALKKEQFKNRAFLREKNLYEKKISATQDYYTAQNEWEEATIELELAVQKLCSLGLCDNEIFGLSQAPAKDLRIYEVRSPITGSIITGHITPGELVANDHELYIVADLSKVCAEINVFAQDRPHVQQGQRAIIKSTEGQKTQVKVIYLSPVIDESTRTSRAIAEIDNSAGIWFPGTFVQAELITETIPVALSIPKEALQVIDGQSCVFVTTEGGFFARPITVGRSDERCYEITSGLLPGERYVSKNSFLLKAELKKDEAEHMD
jgi:cobalt-zinc-cadmium efflux system membrane fusion protein